MGSEARAGLQFNPTSRLDAKEHQIEPTTPAGSLRLHAVKRWTQAHRVVPVVSAKARAKTRKAGSL